MSITHVHQAETFQNVLCLCTHNPTGAGKPQMHFFKCGRTPVSLNEHFFNSIAWHKIQWEISKMYNFPTNSQDYEICHLKFSISY